MKDTEADWAQVDPGKIEWTYTFSKPVEYDWAAHAINRVRMNEDEMLRERLFGADVKEPE